MGCNLISNKFPIKFPISLNGGEDIMVNITFSGTVKEAVSSVGINGASGVITITKPYGSTETLNVISTVDGSFTSTVVYTAPGNYTVKVDFSAVGYNPATSNTESFTIEAALKDMVVTLNVTVG